MAEEDLTAYVIARLAGGEHPDDILYELCARMDWSWDQAQSFLRLVQSEHRAEVARRQFPLLTILAASTYLAGIALMAYSLYALFVSVRIDRYLGYPAPDVVNAFRLVLDYGAGSVILFTFGLAMVMGSLLGMRDAWSSLLDRG